MKIKLHYLFTLALLASVISVKAQDVLWRDGFTRGGTSNFPTSSGNAAPFPGQYYMTSAGLTWYGYGIYNANSSQNCTNAAGNNDHIRLAGTPPTGGDSSFIVTPLANWAGIGQLHFLRSRTNKRFTIYKTSDTLASTTNWTFVAHAPASAYTVCVDTAFAVNDVTARRLKIAIKLAEDTDIDSVWITTATPLPIKFAGINAGYYNGSVKIDWKTATEINLDHYEIERSYNSNEFTSIGSVNAKGNSTNMVDYNWMDNAPFNGTNFYRIKAVEKNGHVTFTSVVKITATKGKLDMVIAPNPIKGREMSLQISSLIKGSYSIRIYNTLGQEVFSRQFMSDGGSSNLNFSLPSFMKTGVYNVQLTGNETKINRQVIVE